MADSLNTKVKVRPEATALDNPYLTRVKLDSEHVIQPGARGGYAAYPLRVGMWVIAEMPTEDDQKPMYSRAVIMRVHQDVLFMAVDWLGMSDTEPAIQPPIIGGGQFGDTPAW